MYEKSVETFRTIRYYSRGGLFQNRVRRSADSVSCPNPEDSLFLNALSISSSEVTSCWNRVTVESKLERE